MKEYKFYGWETAANPDANGLTPHDYYDLLSEIWCGNLRAKDEGRLVAGE
ncbi:MAG: hypothetical protein IKH57_15770 [Clostridia bacterium]|nr:hypothetical protein [Clostridia bacterium]